MRLALSAFLCAGLIVPLAGFGKLQNKARKPDNDAKLFQKKLSKDDQLRHALDRLTFGPRPGDFEAAKKLGLKKWLDRQLHPEKIKENPTLAARLQPLDSLRMTGAEIARNYPPQQLIRQVANGRLPMPEDPVLRAAVQRMVKRYNARKGTEEKDDKVEPARPLTDVLAPAEIRTLRNGKPDEKRELIASMPEDKLDDALIAMAPGIRQQLFNIVNEDTRRKILLLTTPQQLISYDLNTGKLYRAMFSNRQLEELMVDFWYNHFNVYLDKGADRYMVPAYEREAIRPHVLGNFREMLGATAHSPAMLFYLDNWQSVFVTPNPRAPRRNARGLNENYARELLELHTLGVEGGYTQKDIVEVARCFTGWTIRNLQQDGAFFYNDRVHDKGEKVVLGVTIPAGGNQSDGEKVLDILSTHASTARFVSRKLAMRFVADEPPAQLIDRMAATFTKSGGDIRQVMKTMLESKEFMSAGAVHSKVKTPFEMVVSAVRALDAQVEFVSTLAIQLNTLGQPLYRKQEPTGYSTANAEWVNSAALLARMNFALALAQNKIAGIKVDAEKFSYPQVSKATQAAIDNAMKDKTPTPALAAGLIIGSPEFQRR